jgi:DNA-binding NtrC family response regulator
MLPPLRERREDIPRLVEHFVEQVCAQNGWKPIPFTPEAMSALQKHSWPGNVRELRNVVERLILLSTDERVDAATVELAIPQASAVPVSGMSGNGPLADRVQAFERETILAELKRNQFHITNTAKALDLERSHLYKKCEQLGIDLSAIRREQ